MKKVFGTKVLGDVYFLSTFFDKSWLHKSSGLLVVMISLQGYPTFTLPTYICLKFRKKVFPGVTLAHIHVKKEPQLKI